MSELTRLLQQIDQGSVPTDQLAIHALYDEIRRLARRFMRDERSDHTLAPTALANEAYLRLFGGTGQAPGFGTGAEFFAAAATTLRRILVEHGRRRASQRRGGDRGRSTLEPEALTTPAGDDRLLQLDEALAKLAAFDATKARLVELRFFAGLSVAEAARVLGMSERTVSRDWRVARAFLRAELQEGPGVDDLDD